MDTDFLLDPIKLMNEREGKIYVHYYHLCPRMDVASSLLEKLQLPKGYRNISSNPSLVDGLVNPVPTSVSWVDHVMLLFNLNYHLI
jgi:hypothetical protein